MPVDRRKQGDAAFLKGELGFAAAELDATTGWERVHKRRIELQFIEGRVKFPHRFGIGGAKKNWKQSQEKNDYDDPGPHTGSVVTYGMFRQATEPALAGRAVKLGMRQRQLFARPSMCVTLLLLCAAFASADTIVLKNGRKIVALSTVIEGDKVRYETASGSLTLPKSIVDHIEKGPAGSYAAGGANFGLAAPALAPPAFSQNDVEQNTVRDGAVDPKFLAKLDEGAHAGSSRSSSGDEPVLPTPA